jgi:hypothetical protein
MAEVSALMEYLYNCVGSVAVRFLPSRIPIPFLGDATMPFLQCQHLVNSKYGSSVANGLPLSNDDGICANDMSQTLH